MTGAELDDHVDVLATIVRRTEAGGVILVDAARDEERNDAIVLRDDHDPGSLITPKRLLWSSHSESQDSCEIETINRA